MEKRYYLNNMSDSVVTITLSTKRTIKAKSSLPLNSKDVQLFKELKAKRAGRLSAFNDLRLSTIRIEDDSNYNRPVDNTASEESIKARLEAEANELLEDNTEVKDFLDGKTDKSNSLNCLSHSPKSIPFLPCLSFIVLKLFDLEILNGISVRIKSILLSGIFDITFMQSSLISKNCSIVVLSCI